MAKCSICGKPIGGLGLGSRQCDDCKARLEAEEAQKQAALAESERQRRAEWEDQRRRLFEAELAAVNSKVLSGQKVFLYDTIYLPVDSKVLGKSVHKSFDLSASLRTFGLDGWDVAATVPKTVGIGLTDEAIRGRALFEDSGRLEYTGGLGGNVVGVYLVLRKELSKVDLDNSADELRRYVWEYGNYRTRLEPCPDS